jgi:hypothetical protein
MKNFLSVSIIATLLFFSTHQKANAFAITYLNVDCIPDETNTRCTNPTYRRMFKGQKAMWMWVVPGMVLPAVGLGWVFIGLDEKEDLVAKFTDKLVGLGAPYQWSFYPRQSLAYLAIQSGSGCK